MYQPISPNVPWERPKAGSEMHGEGNFKAASASFFRHNMFVQYQAPWDADSGCVVIIIYLCLIIVVVVVITLWQHLIGPSQSVTSQTILATETIQAPLSSVHEQWDWPSWPDHLGYIFQPQFPPTSEGWVLQERGQPRESIKAIMAGFPHLEMGFKQTCKLCQSLLYGARTAQNSSSIWPQGLNQFCMNTHMMQLSSAKLIAKRLATKTHGFDLRSSQ